MKAHLLCILFALGALELGQAEETPSAVRLIVQNKQTVLSETAQQQLHRQMIALLQSSNFHSGPDDKHHIFTFEGVQQDYRDTIATGEYALMIFSPAQKIKTAGGNITAAEAVIGLRSPGGKNSVFTIDETGRIVSHAKYSGEIYMKLKKSVIQTTP